MNERIKQLADLIDLYRVERNEALLALRQGKVDRVVAISLVRNYYPVNLEFPLFLSAAISHVRDESIRQLLVQNLWEEHGSGDCAASHTELFRKFAYGLDLDPEKFASACAGDPAEKLLEAYNSACHNGPAWKALAFLYAFEALFGPLSTAVADGFSSSAEKVIDERYLEFFDVHGVADVEHAAKLQSGFINSARTESDWSEGLLCVRHGAELLNSIFIEAAVSYGRESFL